MADLFRIVTIGADGRARVVRDLEVKDVNYKMRDSFALTPGAHAPGVAAQATRYGGQVTTSDAVGNATLGATIAVKATDPVTAAKRVERLLADVDTARRDLYLEWRPEGLGRSAYSEIRGPGTYGLQYRWIEWSGARRVGIPISWPVAPLPQGLPCAIAERFDPPADKIDGAVNGLTNPTAGASTPTTGWERASTSGGGALGSAVDLPFAPPSGACFTSTLTATAGVGDWYVIRGAAADNGGGPGRLPTRAGRTISLRAKIKIVTQLVNTTGAFKLLATFRDDTGTIISEPLIASSPNAASTYAAAAALELTGKVAAPAGAMWVSVAIVVSFAAAATGNVKVAQLLAAEIPADGDVPAYGDGDQSGWRWAGVPHASQSVELSESKLADYTNATAPATNGEIVSTGAIKQSWPAADGTGVKAHTSRERVADGEVLVGGTWVGATAYDHFIAPGVRYDPEDGRYLYASFLPAQGLTIYYFNGLTHAQLATVGAVAGAPVSGDGKHYTITLRTEGDVLIAQWYSAVVPNALRDNFTQELRFTLSETVAPLAKIMGAGRAGYPMLRGRAGADSALLDRFDWHPYTFAGRRLPDTIKLDLVPGTAPALLEPIVTHDNDAADAGDQQFGMFAWRKRVGNENMLWRGGDGVNVADYQANISDLGINPATVATVNDVPAGQGVATSWQLQYGGVVPAGGAGQGFLLYRPIRKGELLTFEAWTHSITGAGWEMRVYLRKAGATVQTATLAVGAAASAWQKNALTVRTTADADAVFIVFFIPAGQNTPEIHATLMRLYRGRAEDAPAGIAQGLGRGGHAPFGVINAESGFMVSPPVYGVTSGASVPTIDANTLNGYYLLGSDTAGGGTQLPARVCRAFMIDPELIAPPDFAGETLDFEVLVTGRQINGIAGLKAAVFAYAEADVDKTAVVWSREYGSAGRTLLPVTPTTSPHGFVSRLGTITTGRKGRWVIGIVFLSPTTAGNIVHWDATIIAPSWAVASTPTGKPLAGYPTFMGKLLNFVGGTADQWSERVTRPDGSGLILQQGYSYGASIETYPWFGLGGEPIELQPGAGDLLAWSYRDVPDRPDVGAGDGATLGNAQTGYGPAALVRCNLTPRYRVMPTS